MTLAWLKVLYRRFMLRLTLAALILSLIFLYFSPLMVFNIDAGHAGVIWRRFSGGTDLTMTLKQGVHVIWPWNRLIIYDTRLQTVSVDYDVIAKDGLSLNINVNFRYTLDPATLPLIHDRVGEKYRDIVLVPLIGAKARAVISHYVAEDLYSVRREEVEIGIADAVRQAIADEVIIAPENDSFLYVEDALIKSVVLPPRIAEAIERKLIEYQYSLEYDFRLQREAKEAERKKIEGAGVHTFFSMLGDEETNQYLRWRGIEATVQLARSNNSKMVVIGSGGSGMPIILGNAEPPASAIGSAETENTPAPNDDRPYSVGRNNDAFQDYAMHNEEMAPKGSNNDATGNPTHPLHSFSGPATKSAPPNPMLPGKLLPPGLWESLLASKVKPGPSSAAASPPPPMSEQPPVAAGTPPPAKP